MKSKLKALSLGLILAAAAVVGIQAPANAAFADCLAGQACTWNGAAGGGTIHRWAYSVYGGAGCGSFAVYGLAPQYSAKASYGSGHTFTIYSDSFCAVPLATLSGGSTWTTLSTPAKSFTANP
jgi:hypothetical protein